MKQLTLSKAKEKFKTIPQIQNAYNLYLIDDKIKNLLIKEAKLRGKVITEKLLSN